MKYIHCKTYDEELSYLVRKNKCCSLDDEEMNELDILKNGEVITYCDECGEPIFEDDEYIETNGCCYCESCKDKV